MRKGKERIICVVSAKERRNVEKERFNPYQTGHGCWGSAKYPSRAKCKEESKRLIRESYRMAF